MTTSSRLPETILLVEDNAIIAMDTADMLEDAGCKQVLMASDVAQALSHLEGDAAIGCAILDVNLGSVTSLPVAEALAARGVPFVLTTGYGTEDGGLAGYPAAPILTKPHSPHDLAEAVSRLGLPSNSPDV